LLVFLGYLQLILIKLLDLFLHLHLLIQQLSLVLALQLIYLFFMRFGKLDDGLFLRDDDFIFFMDKLLQLVYLIMRVGYLRLQVVDLSNQFTPLISEFFLNLDVIPLINIFLALQSEYKRLILIFEFGLSLLIHSFDIFNLCQVMLF